MSPGGFLEPNISCSRRLRLNMAISILRQAVQSLLDGHEWVMHGDSVDGLTVLDGTPAPTQADVDAWIAAQDQPAVATANTAESVQSSTPTDLQGLIDLLKQKGVI